VQLHRLDHFVTPTALQDPAAPFDLIVRDGSTGEAIRYQMKLGATASLDALDDVRYAGGRVLVPSDTLAGIKDSLQFELEQSARRGQELPRRWQLASEALGSGRLTDELPGGYRIASRRYLTTVARRFYQRQFSKLVSDHSGHLLSLSPAADTAVGSARVAAGEWLVKAGRIAGVAGAGFSLYRGVGDYQRFHAGELDADELATRWGVRGAFAAGGAYAAFAASGPAGWAVGGAVAAGEFAFDHYDAARDVCFEHTLATLERHDRYEAARSAVLTLCVK
jgi:hypothetical protein